MKKRIVSAVMAVMMVLPLAACSPKEKADGERTVTVTVVHGDKSSKDFTYSSAA